MMLLNNKANKHKKRKKIRRIFEKNSRLYGESPLAGGIYIVIDWVENFVNDFIFVYLNIHCMLNLLNSYLNRIFFIN